MKLVDEIIDDRQKYRNKLSKIDQLISDIEHITEKEENINVVRGYDINKALHKVRTIRRKIKNELEVLDYIGDRVKALRPNILKIQGSAINKDDTLTRLSENKVYNMKIMKDDKDISAEVDRVLKEIC